MLKFLSPAIASNNLSNGLQAFEFYKETQVHPHSVLPWAVPGIDSKGALQEALDFQARLEHLGASA